MEPRRSRSVPLRPPPLQTQIQIPLLSWSRWYPSILMWPPPGRRPSQKSLSPNPQQSINRLPVSPRRNSGDCQNHGCQAHNTKPGGIHSIFHIPTRGYIGSTRLPSLPNMRGADSSAAHVRLFTLQQWLPVREVSWRPLSCSWPNVAAKPRRSKALRIDCRTADGQRVRNLELKHFLSQHGVDVCLLSETFVNTGQAFRLANHVFYRRDRLTVGAVQPSWYVVLLFNTQCHFRAWPIWRLPSFKSYSLAGRAGKILAGYLSPSRPLIGANLNVGFGGGLPVFLAGYLNTKNVDWNSELITRRGNTYVIRPTRTPVWSLYRTLQTPIHTTPPLLPMSWTSW